MEGGLSARVVPKLQVLVYDIPSQFQPSLEEGAGKRCSKCARYLLTALLSLNSLDVSVSCRTKTGSVVTPILCDPVGIHRHDFRRTVSPRTAIEQRECLRRRYTPTHHRVAADWPLDLLCCLKVEAWLPPRG